MKAATKDPNVHIVISPPKIEAIQIRIVGTAPYVQLAFSAKTGIKMAQAMSEGDQTKSRKKRPPRDFNDDFEQALHRGEDGRHGIPAAAFRAGMISACRLVGYKMTIGKLSLFCKADTLDIEEGVGLVHIEGDPVPIRSHVRNANGNCDLRVRAKFWPWSALVTLTYDAEQFKAQDVMNLMNRVGAQVGIGEGRPDSKESCGMGWGTFELSND